MATTPPALPPKSDKTAALTPTVIPPEGAAAIPAPSGGETTTIVRRSDILVDWSRNFSRSFLNQEHQEEYLKTMRESAEFKEFTRTIKEMGVINAPLVRRSVKEDKTECPFFLMAGYRRMEALAVLGRDTVAVRIVEADDRAAKRLNIVENLERESITTFNLASAAMDFAKTYKVPSEKVGEEFGLSGAYVRFLVGARRKLHPEILLAWSRRNEEKYPAEYSATSVNFLRTLTAMVPEDATPKQVEEGQKLQLAHFNVARLIAAGKDEAEAKAEVAKGGFEWKEPAKDDDPPAKKSAKVKLDTIKVTAKAIRALTGLTKEGEAAKAGALAMADFLTGRRKTVTVAGIVLFDPNAEEEETEPTNKTAKDVK